MTEISGFVDHGEKRISFPTPHGETQVIEVFMTSYGTGAGCFMCRGESASNAASDRIDARHWSANEVGRGFVFHVQPGFSLWVGGAPGLRYRAVLIRLENPTHGFLYTVDKSTSNWVVTFRQPSRIRHYSTPNPAPYIERWAAAENERTIVKPGQWLKGLVDGSWNRLSDADHR